MDTLTVEQQRQYTKLFTIADADGDGIIGSNDAASFFNLANVSPEILDTIWFSVNPTNQPLNLDQFIFYCELISLAQNNLVPNLQDLMQYKLSGIAIPYARFTGITFERFSDVCFAPLIRFLLLSNIKLGRRHRRRIASPRDTLCRARCL
jgi:hypothetical protein